jgi:energy-coupling factor transport system substrate-specific component
MEKTDIPYCTLTLIMFISKVMMEALPNVHLLGALTITYTVVYRWKALIPIYVYVILNGLFAGFDAWWLPYLYIWTILWAVTMLIPKRMPKWLKYVVYPMLCAIHGLSFGILYSPAQAIMFGLDFKGLITWISAGAIFDTVHGVSNFFAGLLIVPMVNLLRKIDKAKINIQ